MRTHTAILSARRPGHHILDCCMGRGVCGAAAWACGRSFVGIETRPTAFNDAVKLLVSRGAMAASERHTDGAGQKERQRRSADTTGTERGGLAMNLLWTEQDDSWLGQPAVQL